MQEDFLSSGISLMENGDPLRAIGRIDLYLKENPDDPDALCARGICYLKIGKHEEGEQDILVAAALGSGAALEIVGARKLKNNTSRKQHSIKFIDSMPGWARWLMLVPAVAIAAAVGLVASWVFIFVTNISMTMAVGVKPGDWMAEFFRGYIVSIAIEYAVYVVSPAGKTISCVIASSIITAFVGFSVSANIFLNSSPWFIFFASIVGLLAGAWSFTWYVAKGKFSS